MMLRFATDECWHRGNFDMRYCPVCTSMNSKEFSPKEDPDRPWYTSTYDFLECIDCSAQWAIDRSHECWQRLLIHNPSTWRGGDPELEAVGSKKYGKSLLSKLHQVYKEQQEGMMPDHDMLWDVIYDLHAYFTSHHKTMSGWVERAPEHKPNVVETPGGIQFEMTGETVIEAYENRIAELESMMESQDERRMMVAIDNAVNTFHRCESALSHMQLEEVGWFKQEKLSPLYIELLQFLKDQGKMVNPEMFKIDMDNYEFWVYEEEERERVRQQRKDLFGGLRFAVSKYTWAFLITPEDERIDMGQMEEHDETITKYWHMDTDALGQPDIPDLRAEFLSMGGAQVRQLRLHHGIQMAIRHNSEARSLHNIVGHILQGKYPMQNNTSVWIADEKGANTWTEHSTDIAGLLDV